MKTAVAVLAVAALAGAASAQLTAVNNIPGTWVDIAQAQYDTGLHADDSTVGFVATHGNIIMAAGPAFISSNGLFTSNNNSSFSNSALPTGVTSGYAPYWDDQINTGAGQNIYAANLGDRTVIEWSMVQGYFNTGPMTYEIQIFDGPTGPGGSLAQFLYQSVSQSGIGVHANGVSATIGAVQSAAVFAQWSFNMDGAVHDGDTVSIVPAPGAFALLGLGGLLASRRRR